MRGEVVAFDADVGEGEIAGDDLARYRFSATQARVPPGLRTGVRVEFAVGPDRQAREIALLASAPPIRGPAGGFDFGRVVQRTFTAIGQNWQVFLGGAALLIGVPSIATAWGQATMDASPNVLSGLAWAGGGLLYLVGSCLLQGMVLKAAVNGFNGKTIGFSSAFDVGVRMALPLLGLAIVMGLGLFIGFILLIVPAIFLAVMWSVAAPVLVAERRDIIESLRRSADLTKGHRWNVFGLLAIYVLLTWLLAAFIGGVALAMGSVASGGSLNILPILLTPLVNVAAGIVGSAGVASLYYELRSAKDGIGADELAAVFD